MVTPIPFTCSLVQRPKPGLDVLVLLPLPSLLSLQSRGGCYSTFHPRHPAGRDIRAQPEETQGPQQPDLVVSQKRDVEALTQLCFFSTSGGSLSCRWHLGCRGSSVPQGWNPVGLQTLGSSLAFQTCAGPETNLPSNLLFTEIKHHTESASGDPDVRPILKALPSLSLAQVPLPSDTKLCSPWTAEQGLSKCGRALTPFNAGLAEISTGTKAAPCPHFPEKGRAVREGKGRRTL